MTFEDAFRKNIKDERRYGCSYHEDGRNKPCNECPLKRQCDKTIGFQNGDMVKTMKQYINRKDILKEILND